MSYVEDKNDFLQRWGKPVPPTRVPFPDGVLAMPSWEGLTLSWAALGIPSAPFHLMLLSDTGVLGPFKLTIAKSTPGAELLFEPFEIDVMTKIVLTGYNILDRNLAMWRYEAFRNPIPLQPPDHLVFHIKVEL